MISFQGAHFKHEILQTSGAVFVAVVVLRQSLSSAAAHGFSPIQTDLHPLQWQASRRSSVVLGTRQLVGTILLMVLANVTSKLHPRCPGKGGEPPGSPKGMQAHWKPRSVGSMKRWRRGIKQGQVYQALLVKGRTVHT